MAKQKKQQVVTFPVEVFVTREKDQDTSYLLVDTDHESIQNGDKVGVYTLSKVVTKKVSHSLYSS